MKQSNVLAALPGSFIGVTPTVQNKLIHIANREGLKGIAQMQGSTANLYDTVVIDNNAAPQNLDFFRNASGKSNNFTNFQNKLSAGQMNAMQQIGFILLELSDTDITVDATTIIDVLPLISRRHPSFLNTQMQLMASNDVVIDNYNLHELFPPMNPNQAAIAIETETTTAGETVTEYDNLIWGATVIPFEGVPMLLPDQGLSVRTRILPLSTLPAERHFAIMCVVGRFGTLFASRATL